MDAKKEVTQYLRSDRSLMGGRNLYNKLPGKSRSMQNSIAHMTNHPTNLKRLYYELAKLAGITERQLTIILQKPVIPSEARNLKIAHSASKSQEPKAPLTPTDKLLAFTPESLEYFEAKALVKELELTPASQKKDDLYAALQEARDAEVQKQLQTIPQEQKASIKIREQFPFLREKDCPDFLKLLVNDLITAYEKFIEEQPKLHESMTQEDRAALAASVTDNYISNKMAYDELEHYKANGKILGEHPLYAELKVKEEIAALTNKELANKIGALRSNISRNTKKENKDLVQRDEALLAYALQVQESRG